MVKAGRIVPPPGHGFSGEAGCCASGQSGVGALPEFRRALPWSLLPPAPAFPPPPPPPPVSLPSTKLSNLISHLFFSETPHPQLLHFQALLKKYPKWCVVSALSQSCNAQLCQELCTQGKPKAVPISRGTSQGEGTLPFWGLDSCTLQMDKSR